MLAAIVSAAISFPMAAILQRAGPDAMIDPERLGTVVLLTANEDDAVVAAMRGHLTGIGVKLSAAPPNRRGDALVEQVAAAERLAERRAVLAVVWLVGGDDDVATLYLYDPRTRRSFVREVLWTGTVAASAEAVAVVTRRAIEGLREGHPAGMRLLSPPRPAPPKPAAQEVDPPTEAPRHRLRLSAAYLGVNHSSVAPWHSGAMAAIGWQSPLGPYAVAGYQAFGPIRTSDSIAGLELRRHPIDVAAGFRWTRNRIGLEGEVAGVLDLLTSRTTARRGDVRTADALVLDPGVGARARADYAPLPWLRFPVGVGVEFFPRASPFVTRSPDRSVLIAPRVARFRLDAGVTLMF